MYYFNLVLPKVFENLPSIRYVNLSEEAIKKCHEATKVPTHDKTEITTTRSLADICQKTIELRDAEENKLTNEHFEASHHVDRPSNAPTIKFSDGETSTYI